MNISKSDIVSKIRTAIDDIVPTATDSFTSDTDTELWQTTQHAVGQLLEELPLEKLQPSVSTASTPATQDGGSVFTIDSDFLRFVNVRLNSWAGPVSELIERDSDEHKRQRSPWGRGTAEKPRAMLDFNASGALVLACWPSGTKMILNYIPRASVSTTTITCALRDECERLVIYRAASLFFEGKKESEIAEKFRNISTN